MAWGDLKFVGEGKKARKKFITFFRLQTKTRKKF